MSNPQQTSRYSVDYEMHDPVGKAWLDRASLYKLLGWLNFVLFAGVGALAVFTDSTASAVTTTLVDRIGAQTPQTAGLVQLTQQSRNWLAANNHLSNRALPAQEEPSVMEKRIETEIVELHQFFEGWFTGRLANTDEIYSRLSDVLAEGFEMISPQGTRTARADVVDGLRPAHGSWSENEKPGRIWIRNVRSRAVGESHYIATYEEWQQTDGAPRGRLSTVLFRERDDAPNGVEWIHLHETWLPEKK